MTTTNRRQADRVPVGILAQLDYPGGFVSGQIRDLSRTGLRVRVRFGDLGLDERPEDPETALERVQAKSHPRMGLSLNHDRLGSLLRQKVSVTRIEFPEDDPAQLDLCCAFAEPLDDEETALLESHLPPVTPRPALPQGRVVGGVRFEDQPPAQVSVPRPDGRPRQRYRAFISSTRAGALQTFRCHTDLVTGVGVRIAVPRADYGDVVGAAAKSFARRYGTHLDLRLSDEEHDIWSGRVRVSGVEIPPHREEVMLVTLAFDRALALNEMRGLGLLARVA